MRSYQLCVIFAILATVSFHVAGEDYEDEEDDEDFRAEYIDDLIYGLTYDDEDILVFQGEGVTTKMIPMEGEVTRDAKFIETKREKKELANSQLDVAVMANNIHRTYPGAILLANSKLLDNNPDIVRIKRGKLLYIVDFPGMSKEHSTFSIRPSYANYRDGLAKVINNWHDIYAPKGYSIVANFQSESSLVYSKEQLRVALGGEFTYNAITAGIDFAKIQNNEMTVLVSKFKQIYYTVSVEEPSLVSDLFDESVTAKDLRKKKINNENPPVLIDSVTYGRTVYCKIETTSVGDDTKAVLKANMTNLNGGGHLDFDYGKTLKDFSMKVYVLGGTTKQLNVVNAETLADVKKILVEYGQYGRDSPGFPLSYSTIFLRDNNRATIQSFSEYVETTRTERDRGTLSIQHYGAYTVQYVIHWEELSYDQNGEPVIKMSYWYKNWKDINAPFKEDINLAGNCQRIRFYARGYTGLAWEPHRDVISYYDIPLIGWRRFKTDGLTLNMHGDVLPGV